MTGRTGKWRWRGRRLGPHRRGRHEVGPVGPGGRAVEVVCWMWREGPAGRRGEAPSGRAPRNQDPREADGPFPLCAAPARTVAASQGRQRPTPKGPPPPSCAPRPRARSVQCVRQLLEPRARLRRPPQRLRESAVDHGQRHADTQHLGARRHHLVAPAMAQRTLDRGRVVADHRTPLRGRRSSVSHRVTVRGTVSSITA